MTHALDVNERVAQVDESRPIAPPAPRAETATDSFATFAITFGVAFAIIYTAFERLNWPLFTYHPAVGKVDFWMHSARSGEGPRDVLVWVARARRACRARSGLGRDSRAARAAAAGDLLLLHPRRSVADRAGSGELAHRPDNFQRAVDHICLVVGRSGSGGSGNSHLSRRGTVGRADVDQLALDHADRWLSHPWLLAEDLFSAIREEPMEVRRWHMIRLRWTNWRRDSDDAVSSRMSPRRRFFETDSI